MWDFSETIVTFDLIGYLFDGTVPGGGGGGSTAGVHMSQYLFGAGTLWGTPLTDAFGNAVANPSPVNFGALQDVSLDISFDTKMLYGSNQFPLAIGRGKGKISGKAKAAKINGLMWNSIVFGQSVSTTLGANSSFTTGSSYQDVFDTTGIAIPATPFTIAVSSSAGSATNIQMPQSAAGVAFASTTFGSFLSIRDALNNPMVQVASAPAAGQYTITTNSLLFAAGDTGKLVFIDYQYSYTVTGSAADAPHAATVANVLMGQAPSFSVDLMIPYSGKQLVIRLPNCISTKLSIATKLDDFTEPEFDFEAFADSAGRVIIYGTSE